MPTLVCSSFDVLVYTVVLALCARAAVGGHTMMEVNLMVSLGVSVVVIGLDSFNRFSSSPSFSAIVTG
jgi:hypothetical protein